MRLSKICNELDLPKGRVEQWGHRGLIQFDNDTAPGSARDCTKADAARIAMLGYLSKSGVSVESAAAQIAEAMKHLLIFKTEKTFLVIAATQVGRIIPPTPRGRQGVTAEQLEKITTEHHFVAETVRASELAVHLSNADFDFTLVFDLSEIEARVEAFWGDE